MDIRQLGISELPAVLQTFKAVKAELSKQSNDQWKWFYPGRSDYKR